MSNETQILQYFDSRLFCADLKAKSKSTALHEMVEILSSVHGVRDSTLLLDMLDRRESLGSTGIGKGIAIPHGRSLAVVDLRVLFARSTTGIDFDAVDGKPCKLFFLIVAPPLDKRNEYLPLLGRIAELVKEKKARDRLLKVQSFDQLATVLEESSEGGART